MLCCESDIEAHDVDEFLESHATQKAAKGANDDDDETAKDRAAQTHPAKKAKKAAKGAAKKAAKGAAKRKAPDQDTAPPPTGNRKRRKGKQDENVIVE